MRNRGYLWLGAALVLVGLLYLIGILFDINLRGSVGALLLIALGVWLLVRPSLAGSPAGDFRIFGDVVRRGAWKVENKDYLGFIGDVKLDFTQAVIPDGETVIRMSNFIGDMRVVAPSDLAISVHATAFITDVRLFGVKQGGFIAPIDLSTPGYETAPRKIHLEMLGFIGGLKVRAG